MLAPGNLTFPTMEAARMTSSSIDLQVFMKTVLKKERNILTVFSKEVKVFVYFFITKLWNSAGCGCVLWSEMGKLLLKSNFR
jgi:hypothetical protein